MLILVANIGILKALLQGDFCQLVRQNEVFVAKSKI